MVVNEHITNTTEIKMLIKKNNFFFLFVVVYLVYLRPVPCMPSAVSVNVNSWLALRVSLAFIIITVHTDLDFEGIWNIIDLYELCSPMIMFNLYVNQNVYYG